MIPNAGWRIFLLLGLLIVRFGCYELLGHTDIAQVVFTIATLVLACLFLFKFLPRHCFPQYNITKPTLKAIVIAISVGIAMNLADYYLGFLSRGETLRSHLSILSFYPVWFCGHFIFNALPEELLFRGILWGEGRNIKLSNLSILCVQSILFWGAHYYYYDMPFNWINVIVAGLIFGIVAWKTKSILASAIVHAMGNCAGDFYGPPISWW
jgi:membrane protease YdiL (CAAX protease family)